jgi:ribosomal-protein-alanine N-acetyltransferase
MTDRVSDSSPETALLPLAADQLEIRRMRPDDVPAIMAIESVSFGRHHWSEESFYNEMNNQLGRYYVLMEKSAGTPRLAGYCGYWLVVDEAHVTTIAVSPNFRGASLGELLVSHMVDRCLGQTVYWLTLEVRAGNFNAQNLYYKYGFSSMGVRPRYYQDNEEDALIMTTADMRTEAFRALHRQHRDALREKFGGLPHGYGNS